MLNLIILVKLLSTYLMSHVLRLFEILKAKKKGLILK